MNYQLPYTLDNDQIAPNDSQSPDEKGPDPIVLKICLVGRLGSGKSELSRLITEEFPQFKICEGDDIGMTVIVNEALKMKKENKSEEEISNMASERISENLVKINSQIKEKTTPMMDQWNEPEVIDAIWSKQEMDFLKNKRSFFHVITLDTPTRNRYRNFKAKYANDNPLFTLDLFVIIDDAVSETLDISSIISQAKVTLKNNLTLDNLADQIRRNHYTDIETNQCVQKVYVQSEYSHYVENKTRIVRKFKPTWDEYFMNIACIVKSRSSCCKRNVGAVLTSGANRILSSGYNGSSYGAVDCYQNGCKRCNTNTPQGVNLTECVCFHAEHNCILDIGVRTCQTLGFCTLYTTMFPCNLCANIIRQSGIMRMVYLEDYDGNKSEKLLRSGRPKFEIVQQKLDDFVF